jgi:hypothetical protein
MVVPPVSSLGNEPYSKLLDRVVHPGSSTSRYMTNSRYGRGLILAKTLFPTSLTLSF